MIAYIQENNAAHQRLHCAAVKEAFRRDGIRFFSGTRSQATKCDLIVTWGYKPVEFIQKIKSWNIPHLVMERGYLPDRFTYSSMGWNGLNNRAKFPPCTDGGARFRQLWPDLMRPWREPGGAYILLCGQVPGDAALYGRNLESWAQEVTDYFTGRGRQVVFRPHPFVKRHGPVRCPVGATISAHDALEADLEGAELCVTYNSNAGVEAVMFGAPTVAMDPGAMAWPVTSHALAEPAVRPDREAWAHALAWCNWRIEEIADGTAWNLLKGVIR